jgi:hypothetical protein
LPEPPELPELLGFPTLPAFPEELGLVVLAAAFLMTVFDVFLVDFIYHFL